MRLGLLAPLGLSLGILGCGDVGEASGESDSDGTDSATSAGKLPPEGKTPRPPDEPDPDDIPEHPEVDDHAFWEQWWCLDYATKINRLALAPDGSLLVAGRACGTNSTECEAFVSRLGVGGEILWTEETNRAPEELPMGLFTLDDGDIVVVGNTCEGSCQPWIDRHDPGGALQDTHWLTARTEVTDAELVGGGLLLSAEVCELGSVCHGELRRTDLEGALDWSLDLDDVRELAVGPGGHIWVAGNVDGDVEVQRLEPDGAPVWSVALGEPGDDRTRRIELTPNGNALVLADHSSGHPRGSLYRLNPAGDLVWTEVVGWDGSGDPEVTTRDLAVDAEGNSFVLMTQENGFLSGDWAAWRHYGFDGVNLKEHRITAPNASAGAILAMPNGDLLVGASLSGGFGKLGRVALYPR